MKKYSSSLAVLGIFGLIFASPLLGQEIYKWKDAKGEWHFGNAPGEVGTDVQVKGKIPTGTYVITRSTFVFENPSASSKKVAPIGQGMRVMVVGATGDWLEVRSKTGQPPGFIRREDAVFNDAPVGKVAIKPPLEKCLTQASVVYEAAWNEECRHNGQPASCRLPGPTTTTLDQRHGAARDECYKRYPQR